MTTGWTARDALEDIAKGLDKRAASLQSASDSDTHRESATLLSVKAEAYHNCARLLRAHPGHTGAEPEAWRDAWDLWVHGEEADHG